MPTDVERTKHFIEQSFLRPFLFDPDVTDLAYNGHDFYEQKTSTGRGKLALTIPEEKIYEFIKQIANFMNLPFNYLEPFLDVSIDRYRLFAVGHAVARRGFEQTISFSLRIHHHQIMIPTLFLKQENRFRPILMEVLQHGLSMVIGGQTGVGKTQLQKELLNGLTPATRVIIIDNIMELDGLLLPHLDVTMWQVKPRYPLQQLIEAALRSHPDWLLIAESRGKDFQHVLHSTMTGHPIITTLHADQLDSMDQRMVKMLLLDDHQSQPDLLLENIHDHFSVLVYVSKTKTMPIQRTITDVQIRLQGKQWTFKSTQPMTEFMSTWEDCKCFIASL